MFEHLIVPVDLSQASFDAVPVAARMATQVGGRIDVVTVVERLADVALARDELARGIGRIEPLPVEVHQVVHAGHNVVEALAHHLDHNPGAMLAMSSHGHGRSASVLGNTADELLRATFGPLVVIGPHATEASGRLGGNYVVPLDGSARADQVLPIVGAWATEFGATPWLVEVLEGAVDLPPGGDVIESSLVHRRAADLANRIHRAVEFEVLHGDPVASRIVDFAEVQGASLIFMSTHGRTGFERFVAGSVAADVVRRSPVPVVLFRPAMLPDEHRSVAKGARRAAV
jgi:nucleotide-binding universal stress UspA family protein